MTKNTPHNLLQYTAHAPRQCIKTNSHNQLYLLLLLYPSPNCTAQKHNQKVAQNETQPPLHPRIHNKLTLTQGIHLLPLMIPNSRGTTTTHRQRMVIPYPTCQFRLTPPKVRIKVCPHKRSRRYTRETPTFQPSREGCILGLSVKFG